MYKGLTLLAVGTFVTACSHGLSPAIPEEASIFRPPPAGVEAPKPVPPPMVEPPAPQEAVQGVTQSTAFSPEAWRQVQRPGGILDAPEKPGNAQRVVADANAASRVTPSKRGYFGGTAVQRYTYQPGKVYEVLASPTSATSIMLPVGERLAAPPVLNPDDWEVAVMAMGEGALSQHVVVLRPLRVDAETTVPLFTQQGHGYFLHVRATAGTSMVGVQFEVAPMTHIPGSLPTGTVPDTGLALTMPAPQVDVSRLHTAYTVKVAGGNPPWVPVQVYDDGQRSFLRFKESLKFTTAPAIFVRHPDKTLGVVEFLSYEVPEHPERGAYYVINGLWPQMELRGTEGERVRITRQTGKPEPYRVQK